MSGAGSGSASKRMRTRQDSRDGRCAVVTLVMMGDDYVPAALVFAWSYRRSGGTRDLVCMVTHDVSETARSWLSAVFTHVFEVAYLCADCKLSVGDMDAKAYHPVARHLFTKWRCLGLAQYGKVLYCDATCVCLPGLDEVFDLRPPAGTFSSPLSAPWCRGGYGDPCADLSHGDVISRGTFHKCVRSHLLWGTMVLLAPSRRLLADFEAYLKRVQPVGVDFNRSRRDCQALALFMHSRLLVQWRYLHQRYCADLSHPQWLEHGARRVYAPRSLHYGLRRPWRSVPGSSDEFHHWWLMAFSMLAEVPSLGHAFRPGYVQMRLKEEPACIWCSTLSTAGFVVGSRGSVVCPDGHGLFGPDGRPECPELCS